MPNIYHRINHILLICSIIYIVQRHMSQSWNNSLDDPIQLILVFYVSFNIYEYRADYIMVIKGSARPVFPSKEAYINPYKSGVLFMGHRQTE